MNEEKVDGFGKKKVCQIQILFFLEEKKKCNALA